MNRILFHKSEIKDNIATFSGERSSHIMNVLHGEVGQKLKTGEIDGLIGTSEILSIEKPGNGEWIITVKVSHQDKSLEPWVDLILAPPRPRVLKRLLPQLATMGVGKIILVGAKKVEKDFWGATLLKKENYEPLLIDGLMQGGSSILPTIETRRNFRKFLDEELDGMFGSCTRLIAHPDALGGSLAPPLGRRFAMTACAARRYLKRSQPLLIAIGPEGGWTEDEVSRFESKGFSRYSLGGRILRTDTATIALLARLSEKYDVYNS